MSQIKEDLEDLVKNLVIPEVEDYLEELHELLEKNTASKDDLEVIKEMESFLVELHNILEVIKEDSMPQSEYQRVYDKIMKNIKEHHQDEEE